MEENKREKTKEGEEVDRRGRKEMTKIRRTGVEREQGKKKKEEKGEKNKRIIMEVRIAKGEER